MRDLTDFKWKLGCFNFNLRQTLLENHFPHETAESWEPSSTYRLYLFIYTKCIRHKISFSCDRYSLFVDVLIADGTNYHTLWIQSSYGLRTHTNTECCSFSGNYVSNAAYEHSESNRVKAYKCVGLFDYILRYVYYRHENESLKTA